MKKNGQYVGVDEKYIPEDEKYVDDEMNSEIKETVNQGINAAREYVSNKDNQEKMKKMGKKGLKIAKGIGIGYLAFIGFIIIMVIVITVMVFSNFSKINDKVNDMNNQNSQIIENGESSLDKQLFNNDLEIYSGTKYGNSVLSLLDNVITKIKKNTGHHITVTYNDTTTSNVDEISTLKKQFDTMTQYEISLDYDNNGFVNKVTIKNY